MEVGVTELWLILSFPLTLALPHCGGRGVVQWRGVRVDEGAGLENRYPE